MSEFLLLEKGNGVEGGEVVLMEGVLEGFDGRGLFGTLEVRVGNGDVLQLLFLLSDLFLVDDSQLDFPLDCGVPVIFNAVIGSAGQKFGYDCPLISVDVVSGEENDVFLRVPFLLRDFRVEVIVPPLPALLPDSVFELHGNLRPVFGTKLLHEIQEHLVLLFLPIPLLLDDFVSFGGPRRGLGLGFLEILQRETVIFCL